MMTLENATFAINAKTKNKQQKITITTGSSQELFAFIIKPTKNFH